MNASKENAAKAGKIISEWEFEEDSTAEAEFISQFLAACEKKLPSEAAFKKEKTRRQPVAG